MQALILENPETIGIGSIDDIHPERDETLLDIEACGICGGDIKAFKAAAPSGNGPMRGSRQFPRYIVGHEFAGRVIARGKEVESFAEDDLVSLCFRDYCGWCLHCRLDRPNFCLNSRRPQGGGFMERATVHAPALGPAVFKVPAGISVAEAALCEPLTCAIGAVFKAAPLPGEIVVVIGLGGLGQFVAQILTSAKTHVIGIDVQKDKLRKAGDYCAQVIDASQLDPIDEVMRLTSGVGADIVMEVVGVAETFKQSLEMARMGGRVIIVGVHQLLANGINLDRIFRRDLEIKAAKGALPLIASDGTPLAFRYIQEGIARPKELLTTFPFIQAQEAFDRQAHGDVIKGVICQA